MLSPSQDFPDEATETVVLQFEKSAKLHTDRCAVMAGDHRLTFGQLHAEAIRILSRIQVAQAQPPLREDVGVEEAPGGHPNQRSSTIAILVPLGCSLVSSTIATLMSGSAVVPLNPGNKKNRLIQVLASVQPRLVLATSETAEIAYAVAPPDAQVIVVDQVTAIIACETQRVEIFPEDVAYVAFTSGSTGDPKGVIHTHSSLASGLFELGKLYNYSELDIGTLFGVGTGSSLKMMLLPLIHGASIRIFDAMKTTPMELADDLQSDNITALTISPNLFRVVIDALPANCILQNLRLIRLYSDTVFGSDLLRARQHTLPGCEFINLLAMTEAGMVSACSIDLHSTILKSDRLHTVGKPVPGVEVFLRDDSLEGPVNESSALNRGSLWISSPQLMAGYWENASLTNSRLLPHPEKPNRSVFCSNDIAELAEDGSITIVGRSDFQVKIRGWLVDLAEVEATIASHPLITNVAVVVADDRSPEKSIIAFVETKSKDNDADFNELMEFVSRRLAMHMVPRHFFPLDELPLLPNGKLDRIRLSKSAVDMEREKETVDPPRDDDERIIASVWSSVLGIRSIGVHDVFFYLGGSSLSAMRIGLLLEQHFRVRVTASLVFENPTIAELAQRIRSMPRLALSEDDLSRQPDQEEDCLTPATFAQQRVWFLDQLAGGSAAYNMSASFLIRGMLVREVLQQALETLVQRHEALRTVIQYAGGHPYLKHQKFYDFKLDYVDLSSQSRRKRVKAVEASRLEMDRTPFDLEGDLMIRSRLLYVGNQEHVLNIVTHHIASDGWSKSILLRELGLVYNSLLNKVNPVLSEHELRYRDFAGWQHKHTDEFGRQLDFWEKRLADLPDLELPSDRPRPSEVSSRGSAKSFTIPQKTADALRIVASETKVTINTVLCAAFQLILSRYSGQSDFAVAFPSIGRPDQRLESLVGFFADTLLVRADLSGDPSTSELLARVSKSIMEALDNADVPFDRIVDRMRRQRDLSRMPLAQVLFQFMEFGQEELSLEGTNVSRLPEIGATVRFDLEMQIFPEGKTFRGLLTYSTDLFDDDRMNDFAIHYCNLLDQMVGAIEQPISQLSLLSEDDRRSMLFGRQGKEQRLAPVQGVHELVEAQVCKTPNAIASVFGNERLCYSELNERANQFAHHLLREGVDSSFRVGVCVKRSNHVLVAILGILKAGASYVPIDPELPTKRIAHILRQGQVGKIVIDQSDTERIPKDRLADCINIQDAAIKDRPTNNPCVKQFGPAYIIFTSGSTGKPKGVEIPHRAAVNFLTAMAENPGLNADDVMLGLTTISFDISILELLLPLTVGARVVIVDRETSRSPDRLIGMIQASGATIVQATPTSWRMLIDAGWSGKDHLRVLCGGEPLTKSLAEALLARCHQLWNMYGPTETTVWSTIHLIESSEQHSIIGRPIANTRVYVLDEQMQPVPFGVPGHLYIGGDGLALGYYGQPELTAERFQPDPFVNDSDWMIYQTGDICLWERHGQLRFVGRDDRQVKLRGFRIELEEIESTCEEHPEIKQAVVDLQKNATGSERLIAYCIPEESCEFSAASVRKYLEQRLPDYMIPSAMVEIAQLPTTPSGKIDRKLLPTLDQARPRLKAKYSPPCGTIEDRLARVWCEILDLNEVGAEDDFFELGGHSLLAVSLFQAIREEFGKTMPLATLFRSSTIRKLAQALIEHQSERSLVTANDLQIGQGGQPLFVMPTIGGDLLFSKPLVNSLPDQLPIIGLQPTLTPSNLETFRDFRETASVYLSAIKTRQPKGPYALTGFSYGGLLAYEIACQLLAEGEEVNMLAIIDCGITRRIQATSRTLALKTWLALPKTFPSWLREELRDHSVSHWAGNIRRRVRRLRYGLRWDGENRVEVEDIFESGTIPTQNQQLMKTVFAAFRDYRPQLFSGRLFLIKAKSRPLLRAEQQDLGWKQVAQDVVMHEVQGNHETILREPNVHELARQLGKLFDSSSGVARPTVTRSAPQRSQEIG